MRTHQVRCLLMGGQACVLYGGAEFSRDTDLAVLADPEASGMRVDIMSRMRGVADFPTLRDRRTTLEMDDGTHCELRTAELLCDLARSYPAAASAAAASRALIVHAIAGNSAALESALEAEERQERLAEQAYWMPLKQELQRLRRQNF